MPDDQYKAGYVCQPAPSARHQKDIEVGRALVIYVENSLRHAEPGWMLPGCKFTADFATAVETAMAMDKMIRGQRANALNSEFDEMRKMVKAVGFTEVRFSGRGTLE